MSGEWEKFKLIEQTYLFYTRLGSLILALVATLYSIATYSSSSKSSRVSLALSRLDSLEQFQLTLPLPIKLKPCADSTNSFPNYSSTLL